MRTRKTILLPRLEKVMIEVGENIKLARLRRKLSMQQMAERANTSRPTLRQVENGSGSVGIGVYATVLFVLGLETDLLKLATDDSLGRKLQDAGLLVKARAPKRKR